MFKHAMVAVVLGVASLRCPAQASDPACDTLTQTAIDAALGEPLAAYELGVHFYTGRGVPQSYANAASLWETAAGFGLPDAKNNLAFLLSEGLGIEKDPARAVRLWKEAARAGQDEAQVHLGHALFFGDGVEQDRVRGLAWVLRAAAVAPDTAQDPVHARVRAMAEQEKAAMLKLQPDALRPATRLESTVGAAEEFDAEH